MSHDRLPNRILVHGLRQGLFWLLCVFVTAGECIQIAMRLDIGANTACNTFPNMSKHRHFTHKADTCCRCTPKLEHTKSSISWSATSPSPLRTYVHCCSDSVREIYRKLDVSKSSNLSTNKSNLLHNYVQRYFRVCSVNVISRFSKPPLLRSGYM